MYIQEQIVVFLVENVLYSYESLLSIPCWDGTVLRNDQNTEQDSYEKNPNLLWLSQITFTFVDK